MKIMRRMGVLAGVALGCALPAQVSVAQSNGPGGHTNPPPAVEIPAPDQGLMVLVGRTIPIVAGWQNFTDAVAQVDFFAGTTSLGVLTNPPSGPGGHHPEGPASASLAWSNAPAGTYALTAVATDLAGLSITSAPVTLSIVTDWPPVIHLTAPRNGATVLAGTNLAIRASASDLYESVAQVSFFAGSSLLGVVTNPPATWITNRQGIFPLQQTSYALIWSNVPPGVYSLTAVAVDTAGGSTTSTAASLTVVTDLPPVVKVVGPEDGSAFHAPASVTLSAVASSPDESLAGVEFFSGTNALGLVTNATIVTNGWGQAEALFNLAWTNVAVGTYTLTAVATDASGLATTSAPVSISVVAPPPPTVRILDPEKGTRFVAPARVPIATVARYFTNPIVSVQCFSGTNLIGLNTNTSWPTFTWTNVPVGAYTLTAVATHSGGISATSLPVNITVSTNRPPGRHH